MSKMKTSSKNKGKSTGKSNSKNWFLEQQKPAPSKAKSDQGTKNNSYQSLETLPIVKVQMKSNREAEHFEKAYQFALKNSDPHSQEIMTVHLNMRDEVQFNMVQDEAFQNVWKRGELMLLVAFPKNWKTMDMKVFLDLEEMDEDEDELDFDSQEDRFDYLYENGMAVYEGK